MEEIDLKELFDFIKSKIYILILAIIVVVIGGCIYSFKIKIPTYKSSATIILASGENTNSTEIQNDIALNQKLVSTYSEIVRSRKVLSAVITNMNLDYSYEELCNKVSVQAVENTEIITISVVDKNAMKAQQITNNISTEFASEVTEIYNVKNVKILDYANYSRKPNNVNYVKEIIIYILSGGILGLAILFIIFYFDNTVKTDEQVENRLSLPILGRIPLDVNKKNDGKTKDELVAHLKPKSSISENIRTIRTNLQFSSIKENMKVILVASSISGEGKSFISSNLSVAFAQTKKKVLIIDCDIRRGKLHKILNCKDEKGLSDLLISNDDVNDYIIKTSINNLYLITRGTIAPNPSELLSSNRMKKLIADLKTRFDYIILDGVPVNGLSDSLILSKIVDKTVVIASVGYTPNDLLLNTKKSLENVGADIAGIVVNKVKAPKNSYYSKYYE